jgi:hypothetical protein
MRAPSGPKFTPLTTVARSATLCSATVFNARIPVLWLLFLAPLASAQQAPAPEKCIFAGNVRDSISGQPLPRAHVTLRSTTPGKPAYGAATDRAGAFRFEAIDAGDYRILVSEAEHASAQSVDLKPGQATSLLHFTAGQSITGAVAALDPQAVVTGHVMDADGDPIDGAEVALISEYWVRGMRTYWPTGGAVTGENGEYRLTALPGRYFVAARVRTGGAVPAVFSEGPGKPEMRVASLVYPNAPDVQGGTPLDLRPGQPSGGIDFHLPTVVAYHVRGAVRPWGAWTGPRTLQLSRRDGDFMGDSMPLDKDGAFDQAGVLPGSYRLLALAMSQVGIEVPVEVTDRDVEGVIFTAAPPVEIKGRLRFDDGEPHGLSGIGVRLARLDTGHPLGRVEAETHADGTFEFQQVAAAEMWLELGPPGDYYLQSASFNQREVEGGRLDLTSGAAGELEIVLGSGTGTVSGTLSWPEGGSGNAAHGGEIVAVLASATGVTGNTGARSAFIDQNGRFEFSFVPPGRYYVWVTAHYDADHWQNMDFVAQMEDRGVAVELPRKGSVQVEIPAVIE